MGVHIGFTNTITLSAETLFDIAEIPIEEITRLFVAVKVLTTAFDQFVILGRPNVDQDYLTLFNASGDFTSPAGILVGASGDLTALGAGATGWFIIDTGGIKSLKVQAARAAGSNAAVTVQSGGN